MLGRNSYLAQQHPLKVGFLGGGQLARLLSIAAHSMGYEPHVLSETKDDPAAQVVSKHHLGSFKNESDLTQFLKQIDILTFESEFIDIFLLKKVISSCNPSLLVYPNLDLMQTLQDRRSQKELLRKHKVNTADFIIINSVADINLAWQKFKNGFVLKKAHGGYDGYGTFYIRTENDLLKLKENFPGPCIAEAFVSFQKELALIAVCDHKKIQFLPLVETKQKNSKCDWVVGPLSKDKKAQSLQKKISQLLKKISYKGVIAFELFKTKNEIFVNEVAPRVHNSGHYSLDALVQSQFDLHILAGIDACIIKKGLPKLAEAKVKNFAMVNLIGESEKEFEIPDLPLANLHWYGKKQNRPGRKMGHINWVGAVSQKQLLSKALSHRRRIKK